MIQLFCMVAQEYTFQPEQSIHPDREGSTSRDYLPILEQMTRSLMRAIKAHRSFVYLYHPADELFLPYLAAGEINALDMQIFHSQSLHPSTDLLAQHMIRQATLIVSSNASQDVRVSPSILTALDMRSVLVLPIKTGQILLGMILLDKQSRSSLFDSQQIDLATAIANAMSMAVDNLRLYEETHNRLVESQSLHQITIALLQKFKLEEVLELVCSEAQRLTKAMGSSVSLVEDQQWLRVAYHSSESLDGATRFSINDSLLGLAVRRGEPVVINNRFQSNNNHNREPLSLLAIPLRVKDEIIGVLDVINKRQGFTQEDVRLIELYAGQAAVAIEHARLYQQEEEVSVLEERQRLARELHDSVNQSLYGIVLYAEAASRQLTASNLQAVGSHLDNLLSTARDALGEMRLLIFGLRPPVLEKKGLAVALEARLKGVEERSGLSTGFKNRLSGRLPANVEKELYGIAQEALNNVLKHSHASRVNIHLIQSGQVLLMKIEDDGCGFCVSETLEGSSGGLGLKTMYERAAELGAKIMIDSQPGFGTTISVEVFV